MNLWAWAGIAAAVGAVTYWRSRPPGWPLFGQRLPYGFSIGEYWDGDTMKAVDAALFACTRGSKADALIGLSPQRKLEEVQTCMARQVFPEVFWPPVDGDHETVHLTWHKLGMVAERELEGVDIHEETIPEAEVEEADWDQWDEDEDEDEDDGQDPGTIPPEGPGELRGEG